MESGFVTPKPDSLSVSLSLCVSRSPHTTLLNSTTTDHLIIQKLSFVNVIIICFSKSPYTEEIYQSISTLSHSDTPGHGLWVGSFCNSVNSPYFTVSYMHACVYIYVCAHICVPVGSRHHHCTDVTTAVRFHHNKDQLNSAASQAKQPTASRTSTNTQISLKPRGGGSKAEPRPRPLLIQTSRSTHPATPLLFELVPHYGWLFRKHVLTC